MGPYRRGDRIRNVLGRHREPTTAASAAPVYPGDFPDPFVLPMSDRYYAYATQTGGINVQVMMSPDLASWTHLGEALPTLPTWAGPGRTWSPAVLRRQGGYVLYVAVRHEASGRQCIASATSREPAGPFVEASSAPLVAQLERGGCIDPSAYVDVDGTAYLFWKSDDDAIGQPACIWGAELAADGLSFAGPAVKLIVQTGAWEMPRIEAPSVVRWEGTYYLFYSAGAWVSAGYAIGYARGNGPLGSFAKATRWRPWLSSRPNAAGPGGAEIFIALDTSTRIAYHAWDPARVGYEAGGARSIWIDRLAFVRGHPVLSAGVDVA